MLDSLNVDYNKPKYNNPPEVIHMIEIDLQLYAYTLCLVMIAAITSMILVIHLTESDTLSISTNKLFKIYFALGLIAWISLLTKDAAHLPMDQQASGLFYILCTYVLFFAVEERARKPLPIFIITIIHLLISTLLFLTEQHADKVLIISTYALAIYPFLSFILIQRAIKLKNLGHAIMAFAFIIVSVMSPLQVHFISNLGDPGFAYSLGVIAAAVGYTLVGVGYLSSILISEQQLLRTISTHDPLTGLLNRRGLDLSIRSILGRTNRSKECISVIALDIDHFKHINDTYGHDAGDLALKTLATVLSKKNRESDIWCRLGGEEFGLVLPTCPLDAAQKTAETIRQRVEEISITYEQHTIKFTASLGVSSACSSVNIDELLKDADKALYTAKNQGRNQVCVSEANKAVETSNLVK